MLSEAVESDCTRHTIILRRRSLLAVKQDKRKITTNQTVLGQAILPPSPQGYMTHHIRQLRPRSYHHPGRRRYHGPQGQFCRTARKYPCRQHARYDGRHNHPARLYVRLCCCCSLGDFQSSRAPATARRCISCVAATSFSTACIIIRNFYRAVQLSQGWEGYLVTHEVCFDVLDGRLMVLAALVFNFVASDLILE